LGYVVQRNRAARLATADIIVSLDDDAILTSPQTVAQTLAEFDHPRVGAVAIPYVEPRRSMVVHQKAPSRDRIFVTDTFIGTAHAVRRDLFLWLTGYREFIFHQGEEADFCIRMLGSGYVVRLGSAEPIHHMESPRRDLRRMDFYGRRNDILFAWHNVPTVYLPLHLLGTSINGLWSGIRVRRPLRMLQGTINGFWCCMVRWHRRQPVAIDIYVLNRRLKKRGPKVLEEIEPLLPTLEVFGGK
jgi:GT2 family glycosyltransferase